MNFSLRNFPRSFESFKWRWHWAVAAYRRNMVAMLGDAAIVVALLWWLVG